MQLEAWSLSWHWSIQIQNISEQELELDLVYLQDIGLKPVNAGLQNEYYVAQYMERIILEDEKYGSVICCRQNMKESTGYPWVMLACLSGAASGSTDGMQFYGRTFRETGIPEGLLADTLSGNYAGESPIVALQEQPFKIAPAEAHQSIFYGKYIPDHPQATSSKDLNIEGTDAPLLHLGLELRE